MLNLEYQILIAFLLDLAIGDPHKFPHPVRAIGKFAIQMEAVARKRIANLKIAGITAALAIIIATGLAVHIIIKVAGLFHPFLKDLVSIYFLYSSIALHDLIKHSNAVYQDLLQDDEEQARSKVALIVGRDTDKLDKEGITKAAIESVAENMVDGIIAPLFFAAVGGPVGVLLYKAVNTLDSTYGYKNTRYINFGWAAARLDDLVNFIPARLAGFFVPVAAILTGLNFRKSFAIFLRDRFKHASPNSGHPEAAVAGALGIQLGGPASYFGQTKYKPYIGDQIHMLEPEHIRQTNLLVFVSVILALVLFLGMRVLLNTSL